MNDIIVQSKVELDPADKPRDVGCVYIEQQLNCQQTLGYSLEQFITLAIQDSLEQDGIHLLVQLKEA